ncbi:transcription initiation factor TFIID subunit 4b-like isoform X2 [Mercurialis annua]|uniref:transcription initiation factor TFIID subunit 4b-like isoform X2 n=1 Tax=Mercurialis annua TaxID=3986 RepID=UPI0024ADB314|nr:transcription initiation factor TFIID subunit 4b-like isoform X2 [Mercurialis annua]
MEPAPMEFLKEDEDQRMYSGADVDAFQATVNRDIGGGGGGGNASSSDEYANASSQQQERKEQHLLATQITQQWCADENQQQIPGIESQYVMVHNKMGNRQAMGSEQPGSLKCPGKRILDKLSLLTLKPVLDNDREMQPQTLPGSNQAQLQCQDFACRDNAGLLISSTASSAVQMQTDSSYTLVENNAQKSREVVEHQPDTRMQVSHLSSSSICTLNRDRMHDFHSTQNLIPAYGSNNSTFRPYSGTNANTSGSSMKSHPHDLQVRQISHSTTDTTQIQRSIQGRNVMNVSKFEKPNSAADFSRLRNSSLSQSTDHLSCELSTNKGKIDAPFPSRNYVKQEPVDQDAKQQQKFQFCNPQDLSAALTVAECVTGNIKDNSLMRQPSAADLSPTNRKMPTNVVATPFAINQNPNIQVRSQTLSAAASTEIKGNSTPPNKLSAGQKKALKALGSVPPALRKKKKVSGSYSYQSIEELNDVASVSGIDLRAEQEQLISGLKEVSRVSEASRRNVQEDEERMILQKIPLEKKLAAIIVRCGLKNINSDVEQCLSLCVEERMCELISTMIRLSKQRMDAEKLRHGTVITSDVRQEIMAVNKKAREESEIMHPEVEMLRKVNEVILYALRTRRKAKVA